MTWKQLLIKILTCSRCEKVTGEFRYFLSVIKFVFYFIIFSLLPHPLAPGGVGDGDSGEFVVHINAITYLFYTLQLCELRGLSARSFILLFFTVVNNNCMRHYHHTHKDAVLSLYPRCFFHF